MESLIVSKMRGNGNSPQEQGGKNYRSGSTLHGVISRERGDAGIV